MDYHIETAEVLDAFKGIANARSVLYGKNWTPPLPTHI